MLFCFFVCTLICRWNCLGISCILCSQQCEVGTIFEAHIWRWGNGILHSPQKKSLGERSCLGDDWSYLVWNLFAFFWGLFRGKKMNYSWSRRNLNQKSSGQCLCSSSASVVLFFIWIVFHSSCFWFIYFKEQETDASEYVFECCCLIHTSNTMKFWKVSLHNILSAIMGLWCLLIWGVSQIQTKCGFGCLVTDTRFITACSSAYVTLLTQN